MKVSLLVFLAILSFDQVANSYRILGMFPLQGKSHWIMQEALMKDLARRGHQVDVFAHFPLKKPIPNYKNISLKGSLPQFRNNLTAQEIQTSGTLSWSLATLIEKNGIPICNLLNRPKIQELIKNPPQDSSYDIIILEVCSTFSNHQDVRSSLYVIDENEKFYKRLCEHFLQFVESLKTVSRAEIAMLQRLKDVYIRKAFAKCLKNLTKI